MIRVVGVGFKSAGKIYYFDPGELELSNGENVIVETGRGMEYGTVRGGIKNIPESEFGKSLKKVVRKATERDTEKNASNLEKKNGALATCREKINARKLDMKLIDVEFTFDDTKVIFYFTAENRVDFRELVKDLASVFKRRIELRQVGVRDEAKMLGGIGSCGRGLCCNGWLQDFEPVSIKMAKVQNLSLNPTKISGCCGRLMCCLKYENDIYQEMKKGMPNQGEFIETKEGHAKVIEANILMSTVKVRLVEEERSGTIPEKLSSDIYTFNKSEIKRLKKTGKKNGKNENKKAVSKGIEKALADDIIDILSE
ncbi:MAG: stage 0 sporulation family protein [Clostridiales Family XIII bacterium]|jgi:cell fate regulator YaaT (PSP1 superfamily)|nr:stage 0 sporulation family protein [Clostridiales Family XIII bacterium]